MSELKSYATNAEARKACPPGWHVVMDAPRARVGAGGVEVDASQPVAYYVMPPQTPDLIEFYEWKAGKA